MNQTERRIFLIKHLLSEQKQSIVIPEDETGQKRLLRALFNIRMPMPASGAFLEVQDAYLQKRKQGAKGLRSFPIFRPPDKGYISGRAILPRCAVMRS